MSHISIITDLKEILVGGAAIVTASVAIFGLKTWNRELRGKANFEVARGLIRATYKLRDDIASCRSPLVTGQEFPADYYDPQEENSHEKKALGWAHVYKNRWKPVWSSLQEFDAQTLEAEALWGHEVKLKTDKLRHCVNTLNVSIEEVISDKASGGRNFESDRKFGIRMRNNTAAHGSDDNNSLSTQISDAITGIEDLIRPHLERS